MQHNTTEVDVAKLYLPQKASDSPKDTSNGFPLDIVGKCVKRRASNQYGGFTEYKASGGWVSNEGMISELITEDVNVIEIIAPKDANVPLKNWVNVNLRMIKKHTNEDMVMALVNGTKITVE